MALPVPVPAALFTPGNLVAELAPEDLVVFLLNVGDGDTQLILLPTTAGVPRRAIVVDVFKQPKLTKLVETLRGADLLRTGDGTFPLAVATHPHLDHIKGFPAFLALYRDEIGEFWEPGFVETTAAYHEMMVALEDNLIRRAQPTSGLVRWFGQTRVTVVAPSVRLRHEFETHGTHPNNSSIAMRVEFPSSRVEMVGNPPVRRLVTNLQSQSLLLGADAQSQAWAQAMVDFPLLKGGGARAELSKKLGPNALDADVFKVPHHASKNGLHLELVSLVKPELSLVSSASGADSTHGFPHDIAQLAIREAIDPQAGDGGVPHDRDWEHGIHYTCGVDDAGAELGTIAVVFHRQRRARTLWRFGDAVPDDVDLTSARRFG